MINGLHNGIQHVIIKIKGGYMKKKIKVVLLIIFGIGLVFSIYNISLWCIDNYHTKKVTKLIKEATVILENGNGLIEDEISNGPTYELVNKPDDLKAVLPTLAAFLSNYKNDDLDKNCKT